MDHGYDEKEDVQMQAILGEVSRISHERVRGRLEVTHD